MAIVPDTEEPLISGLRYDYWVREMKFKVVLEPQPEGGYVAYVPALSGCFSQGETKEEALKNIKEAIELYLEVLEEKELGKTMKKFIRSDKSQIVEVSL